MSEKIPDCSTDNDNMEYLTAQAENNLNKKNMIERKKIELFESQNSIMENIYNHGMQEYVNHLNNLKEAFCPSDLNVRCIDEGTTGGIHLAGSGILLGLEKAAEMLKKSGAEGITSHEECGAAGLFAKSNGLDISQADEYGKEFAKKLAEVTGLPYKGHIALNTMKRPSGLHIARVAYYDGSGSFNFDQVEGLPAGFEVDRKFLNNEYAREEATVCVNIAMGGHGFGELITEKAPFLLVVIGDSSDGEFGIKNLIKELEPVADSFGGRVKIDSFVIPA